MKDITLKEIEQLIEESLETGMQPQGDLEPQEHDHEMSMARADLLDLVNNSMFIYDKLKGREDNANLPGWVAAKLTLAADYVDSVKDYLVELNAEKKQ